MDKICAVSGTGGYLGGRVKAMLEQAGWRVLELTRAPRPGSKAVAFKLGGDVSPTALAGAKALVHCAYDFKPLVWTDIHAVNVEGSAKLFESARQAGIERVVFISSISAFAGCRSLYGKAKLETEALALAGGAMVIRPGLIYGEPPQGIYGRLVTQVEKARLLPLFGGGTQIQYLVHEADLARIICRCAAGEAGLDGQAATVCHERPWTFRQILEEIARAKNKRLAFIPVPWRLAWAGIKSAELCGVPLNFRSDSLVSLMYQNPNPSFEMQRRLGFECRAFGSAS